jgi:hypothetical protein
MDAALELHRPMSDVLGRRALNRATLDRQLLLGRSPLRPLGAIEHLIGLQAQVPKSPYLALWTRLDGFRLEDLTALIHARRVVRIALMRSTIHMVTARDCLGLRPLMQPVVERGVWTGTFGRRLAGINRETLAITARALVEEQPRTFNDLGKLLRARWPGRDALALAMAARALVPLVQIPPRGLWGLGGLAAHTSVETWLGKRRGAKLPLDRMVLRYLAAFGPAGVRDMQAWSGLTRLREVAERLRRKLRTFRDERGQELFDLPDAPRPGADVPALSPRIRQPAARPR